MTSFQALVYSELKKVPKGRVTTYALLAKACGNLNAARAVGNALNKNTHLKDIPCHRVVLSDGRLGGFAEGAKVKIAFLKEEGITVKAGRIVEFQRLLYKFH